MRFSEQSAIIAHMRMARPERVTDLSVAEFSDVPLPVHRRDRTASQLGVVEIERLRPQHSAPRVEDLASGHADLGAALPRPPPPQQCTIKQ